MYGLPDSEMYSGLPGETTTGTSEGPPVGFTENFQTQYVNQALNQSANGASGELERRLQQRNDTIKQLTGQSFPVTYAFPELADAVEQGVDKVQPSFKAQWRYGQPVTDERLGYSTEGAGALLKQAVDQENKINELRKQYPSIPSARDLVNQTKDFLQNIQEGAASDSRRATGAGAVGGFTGDVGGSFTVNDPFNLATIPFGGFGKSVAMRIGTEALTQAGISLADQYAFVRPEKQAWGQEFSNEDALKGALYAGVGGALFRGGAEAIPAAARGVGQFVPEKANQIASALDDIAQRDTRLGRLAASITKAATREEAAVAIRGADPKDVSDLLDRADPNPTSTPTMAKAAAEPEILAAAAQPKGMDWQEHISRADNVAGAMEAGHALPDYEPTQGNTIGLDIPALRARDLNVDADMFQFKGGGDGLGVTERLKGIQEWNPDLAGAITVWERADGQRFVADGHQRVALAKRIMGNSPDTEIKIPSFVYREKDGITAAEARAQAALINIGQGTGSALDAARVFQHMPESIRGVMERSLPPNSALVQQGRHLMNLGDEPFAMVAQGVVPENYAAFVGRETADHAKQLAVMKLLQKAEPDNAFQAEQIVKQALADDIDMRTVGDLFGDRIEAAPLYADKAKVLDLGLKLVRRERGALNNLIKNDDIIAAYGNAVNLDATRAGLDGAAILQYVIQKQAFTRGPIADALTQAAREVQNGTRHASAARAFINALRERMDQGGAASILSDGADAAAGIKQALGEAVERERQDLFAQGVKESERLSQPENIQKNYDALKAQTAEEEAVNAALNAIHPDETLPLGDLVADAEGKTTQRLTSMRDLMDEISKDDDLAQSMKECLL